jgi:hypothetical protein
MDEFVLYTTSLHLFLTMIWKRPSRTLDSSLANDRDTPGGLNLWWKRPTGASTDNWHKIRESALHAAGPWQPNFNSLNHSLQISLVHTLPRPFRQIDLQSYLSAFLSATGHLLPSMFSITSYLVISHYNALYNFYSNYRWHCSHNFVCVRRGRKTYRHLRVHHA